MRLPAGMSFSEMEPIPSPRTGHPLIRRCVGPLCGRKISANKLLCLNCRKMITQQFQAEQERLQKLKNADQPGASIEDAGSVAPCESD